MELRLLEIVKIEALGLSIFIVVNDQFSGTLRGGRVGCQFLLGPFLGLFLLLFLTGTLSLTLIEGGAGVSCHRVLLVDMG
jgi:hypothetical protein